VGGLFQTAPRSATPSARTPPMAWSQRRTASPIW